MSSVRLFKFTLFFLFIFGEPSFLRAKTNWEFLLSQEGVQVFKGSSQGSSPIPFKATGTLKFPLAKVLEALVDETRKPLWAPKLKRVHIHHKESDLSVVLFSEFYKTPWPAYDREFLLQGSLIHLSKNKILLKARSLNNSTLTDDNHIQAKVDKLNLLLEGIGSDETRLTFEFHGDMMGYIPKWLSNIIQRKWPLKFILGLRAYLNKESLRQ